MTPAPLDLTGRRFGALTVLERGPRVTYGGTGMWSWRVRCDCGATETYPQKALTKKSGVRSCQRCRRPICDVCGEPFERSNPNQRYHPECAAEVQRQHWRDYYYRKPTRITLRACAHGIATIAASGHGSAAPA